MKAIDVFLESVLVKENGRKKSGEAVNLIEFCLVYPREGVPNVVSIKKAKLIDGKVHEPDGLFEDKLVFRETLRGAAQLNVKVVTVDNPSALEKFFALVLNGFLSGALAVSTKGVSNVITGKVQEVVGGSFIKSVSDSKDGGVIIGEGHHMIDPDNLSDSIELDLSVKDAVMFSEFDVNTDGYVDKVLIASTTGTNNDNGTIKLKIKAHN